MKKLSERPRLDISVRLLLAELGHWDQHNMLPKRKAHGLSRQAAVDPKQPFANAVRCYQRGAPDSATYDSLASGQ